MHGIAKHLPLVAFMLLTALSVQAGTGIKSYREWKNDRVIFAQAKVTSLKSQIETQKSIGTDPNLAKAKRGQLEAAPTKDLTLGRLEKIMNEEVYDLELAQELSVTDYFVGYLIKVQNKKSAFQEVAGKLSPEEVAELMTAYANSVFGAHQSDLPPSASNITKESTK